MLSIYQILLDRFCGDFVSEKSENCFMGGTIQGVVSRLEYIVSMGFNTLYLSPFCTSSGYHGYHVEDYFAVDPHFGTLDDLKELIAKAHSLNLKIMMDFVPNHCSKEHPFFQEALKNKKSPYRKWFYIKKDGSYRCFLNFEVLPKINLSYKDAADHLVSACKYWCSLGIDYVRVDHAIGLPFAFLGRLSRELKELNGEIKIYGEVWGQGIDKKLYKTLSLKNRLYKYIHGIDQERLQMDYVGVLDGLLDFSFLSLMEHDFVSGNLETLQEKVDDHFKRYPETFDLILMLDNHDTNRFLYHTSQDIKLLLRAVEFMVSQKRSFSIYYGTEIPMTNIENIFSGKPYADLAVREPLLQQKPLLSSELSKIIASKK